MLAKAMPAVALSLSAETNLDLAILASHWTRGSLKGPEFSIHILGVPPGAPS